MWSNCCFRNHQFSFVVVLSSQINQYFISIFISDLNELKLEHISNPKDRGGNYLATAMFMPHWLGALYMQPFVIHHPNVGSIVFGHFTDETLQLILLPYCLAAILLLLRNLS